MTEHRLQPQPPPTSDFLDLLAELTGNELKLLSAIIEHAAIRAPITINALAAAARIDRTTVMRLIPSLCDKGYIELTPTAKAHRLVGHVRRQLIGGPEVSVMLTVPPADMVAISDRAQRAEVNPQSQNTTDSVAQPQNPRSDAPPNVRTLPESERSAERIAIRERAKEHARLTAKQLNDTPSLGLHIAAWYAAFIEDELRGNRNMENALMDCFNTLIARQLRTGQHQGPAITARLRELFKAHQVPLNIKGGYANRKD